MRCLAWQPVMWLAQGVARLPQAALLSLGRALTWVAWPLLRRRRRIAAINVALCFPQLDAAAQRRLLSDNLCATVTGALELLRAWYAPPAALHGLAEIEGADGLLQALAGNRGVLLLTAHFTHTELAVRLLSEHLRRPIGGIVRHNNSPCLERELQIARSRVFGPTLEKKDMRGLLRALKSGWPMAYSADQDFSYRSSFVPFFGVDAATLVSTPDLVRRAGAQMFSLFCHRDAAGRYHLQVQQAWPGWDTASPADAAAIYMRELEAFVREHPDQYLWVHRRFKTRPPGQAQLYP